MTTTIISKNYGSQKIDINNFNVLSLPTNCTIFKIIEHMFNDWFEHNTQPGAPLGKDIEGMYFGEGDQPAIYSKKGAIQQGVEVLVELLLESPKSVITTKDIMRMDIECAFQ